MVQIADRSRLHDAFPPSVRVIPNTGSNVVFLA